MRALFFNMLSASFYGSVVILAVLLLRLVLKKAPRGAICLLWLLAGIRLVLPFTIESRLSLQPSAESIAQIRQEIVYDTQTGDSGMDQPPALSQTGQVPAIPQQSQGQEAELPGDVQIFASDDAVTDHTRREVDYGTLAAWGWAAGILGLLAYSAWSYWRLRRWVREAVRQADGSWECPGLETAFVLGLFRPRIYLPGGLSDRDRELILAHERSHIARKDHWIKPVGYLVLMLHWFNPLVWLAYVCLCRDIEMACDERVVKNMDVAHRKDYSRALLNCGSRRMGIAACPVAFGEVGVKQRILGVLHYRKPGFWVMVAAVVAVVFVVVCLMTGPAVKSDSPLDPENAASMLENRTSVIAVEYKQNINGSISICRAEGEQVAEVLAEAHFRSWPVSRSHGDFTAYVDLELLEGLSLRVFDNGHADMIRDKEIWHFGAPRGLYEQLHALLTPANSEDVITAALEMGSSVWNLDMTLEDISPTGLRLSFTQSGWFPGSATGSLLFGEDFALECFDGEDWVPVEKVTGDEPTAWPTVAYLIGLDGTVSRNVDWSWLYGELAPGRYRIVKDVTLDLPNQQSLNADFYAKFYLGGVEDAFSGASGNAWGLTLEARDITPTGMTLVCAQQGVSPGTIITGEAYVLYARKGQGWTPVPMVTREAVWRDIAWEVNQDGQTEWTLDWKWLYGELPQGEYLLVKEFCRDGDDLELRLRFTVGETAAVQWEELPALELCRRALEDFLSRESGYVTWENSFGSNGVIQSKVTGEYWFAGENWLRKIDPNSASSVYRLSYLGIGDRVYRGSGDEVEEWFAVGDQGAAGLRPWIYGLTWDEEKISLLYDEWQDDERQITLEVRGTPPAVVDGSVTQYQVTFRFDREGNFLGTGHAYLEPGEEVDTMVVSTMDIREPAGKTPEQVLADAMEPLLREENRYLELCREALEEFQTRDTYHVTTTTENYNRWSLESYVETQQWYDGNNWLRKEDHPEMNGGVQRFLLEWEGVCHRREICPSGENGWPCDSGWYTVDSFYNEKGECWLRSLDWDAANVCFLAAQDLDGGCRITCQTELPGGLYWVDPLQIDEITHCVMTFFFDDKDVLVSVELLICYDTNGSDAVENSVLTVDIGQESDNAIGAAIEAAYGECRAAMENELLVCMDAHCQDASHDHSARDCTDADCTIPSHHHDHDHH